MRRKLFATTLGVTLAASAVALAQPGDRGQGGAARGGAGAPVAHGGGGSHGGFQGGFAGPRGGGFAGPRGGGFMSAPTRSMGGMRSFVGGAPQRGRTFTGARPNASFSASGRNGAHFQRQAGGSHGRAFTGQATGTGHFARTAPSVTSQRQTGRFLAGHGAPTSRSTGGHAGFLANGVARQGRVTFGAPGFKPGGTARPHYSAAFFPPAVTAQARFHWQGAWTPQPGFYFHRWVFGDFLPFGWYGSPFWIVDYWWYDLPISPIGFAWIRVGPDALLVDLYTGEVVEVVYGLFWWP